MADDRRVLGSQPGSSGSGRASGPRTAYAAAGVDVEAGERAVDLMRAAVASTHGPAVVGGFGGYGGAIRIPPGLREPLLVSSTDGVGTKTAIAAALGRFDTIGRDLVAMCADDVVCSGAEPLAFLDYIAVGRLVPEQVAELVSSIADGCREAGCALLGGETAEHPGLMAPDTFDLAGFCIGVVEADAVIDSRDVRAGDAIIGLLASGLHSNGFSLVRALLAQWDIDLRTPYQEQLRRSLGDVASDRMVDAEPDYAFATLGEVLLTPTRIYARAVVGIRRRLLAVGSDLRAVAHVTGGGLPGALPRVLPDGLAAVVDPTTWPMPSVIRLFGALGGLDAAELRATFNGGIGMALVVPAGQVDAALAAAEAEGVAARMIGHVTHLADAGGRRYLEADGGGLP